MVSPNCCAVQTQCVVHDLRNQPSYSTIHSKNTPFQTQQTVCNWPHLFCLLMSCQSLSGHSQADVETVSRTSPASSTTCNISLIGTYRPPPACSSYLLSDNSRQDRHTNTHAYSKSLGTYISQTPCSCRVARCCSAP